MIRIENVTKQYEDTKAIDRLNLTIEEGKVFGLLGTNGAGKSTLLRMLAGVLKADSGQLTLDDQEIYENPKIKGQFFYISDDQYHFENASPEYMAEFYRDYYPAFDLPRYLELLEKFGLDRKKKIRNFSKGMKKQLFLLLGICAGTRWLLCDETFDGLDPVMRQAIKSLLAREMCEREFTPVIASHNLRELEDICDHVGLLHRGGILLSRDLDDMKLDIHKVQFALKAGETPVAEGKTVPDKLGDRMTILQSENRGSLYMITARGKQEEIEAAIEDLQPLFAETLPLSLEEIFITETGVTGYDIKQLLL